MVKKTLKHSSTDSNDELNYERLDQRTHIVKRPDTVIGAIRPVDTEQYVLMSKTKIRSKVIKISHGLMKIIDEIIVNASDQISRTREGKRKASVSKDIVTEIRVWVNNDGEISVWNNGMGIPVQFHSKEKMYIPELIFGVLLTSENFDDTEKRTTGGKNGFGAKLTNIFSKVFKLKTTDQKRKKMFEMTWSNNMLEKSEPIITEFNASAEDAFVGTKVTFLPDYEYFKMKGLTKDIISLIKRRVYDVVACSPPDVKIYFNDTMVPVKSVEDYAKMAIADEYHGKIATFKKNRWDLAIGYSEGTMQQISFVNSIHTLNGGTHVDHVINQITKYIQTTLEKLPEFKDKSSKHSVKISEIKKHLFLVMASVIENPDFDSQSKEVLKTPPELFGSHCNLSKSVLKCIVEKMEIIDYIKDILLQKNMKSLQRGLNTKKNRLFGIPKLEDANNAGTKKSKDTMLFITEGDSAASMVRAGLSVLGRNNYGIFPLRGKLINVRSASTKDSSKNVEIQNLIKILGLRIDMAKKYHADNIDTLRYGSLCILTDQDHDGSHIKGLVLNFLHCFFPSLLEINGFIKFFITPICKVQKNSKTLSFYTYDDMDRWFVRTNQGTGWRIKFYKGLGTSTSKEAKEYFGSLEKHLIDFKYTNKQVTKDNLELAFRKDLADKRKAWVNQLNAMDEHKLQYNPDLGMTYESFINEELILFSIADNIRSIPNIIDGMKPSQRKVLYGSMSRKNKSNDIKVSQLAGDISLRMSYHHGEASLVGTIINMAQDFTGSNNLNQLVPSGQFGSRVMGGKDHASARYIFTRLNEMVESIYHPHDAPLLNYNVDDGQTVEPSVFVPILPMLLVNGASGIGTGYSCDIPSYNPRDIVANLRAFMNKEKPHKMMPWYQDFIGTVSIQDKRYISRGIYERSGPKTIKINELPVNVWTQTYKEKLMKIIAKKDSELKNFNENSTERTVSFELEYTSEKYVDKLLKSSNVFKKLDIESKIKSNLYAFDHDGKIKKYKSPIHIIEEFYEVRYQLYTQRRIYLLTDYSRKVEILENKLRYLREVINGDLVVFRKKKDYREKQLIDKKYKKFDIGTDLTMANPDENGTYAYLSGMSIDSFGQETIDRLETELTKLSKLYQDTKKTNEIEMWNRDLDAMMVLYEKWSEEQSKIVEMERLHQIVTVKKTRKIRKRKS